VGLKRLRNFWQILEQSETRSSASSRHTHLFSVFEKKDTEEFICLVLLSFFSAAKKLRLFMQLSGYVMTNFCFLFRTSGPTRGGIIYYTAVFQSDCIHQLLPPGWRQY